MAGSIFTKHHFATSDEIRKTIDFLVLNHVGSSAIIGGVALRHFGCPQLTFGLDMACRMPHELPLYQRTSLVYGGDLWKKPGSLDIKIVVRRDDYEGLYSDAIEKAIPGPEGFPTARPEHLAAMKLAIHDLRHRLDLKWLLGKSGLVDRYKLRHLVGHFVGGRFAMDALEVIEEEVALDLEEAQDRDEMSYP